MVEGTVTIVNPLGLHARAAAQLVRTAGTFKSRITLHRDDLGISADAKSILSVLTLAASMRSELVLRVEGEDEESAAATIRQLFADGFGEI